MAVIVAPSAMAEASARPGTVDRSFADNGTLIHDFDSEPGEGGAGQLIVQPDGTALIRAGNWAGGSIGRYLPNGDLDASFGKEGYLSTVDAETIAMTSDGRIVVSSFLSSPATRVRISRFLPDGSPDPSFGTGGAVTFTVSPSLDGVALVPEPDGKLLVVGRGESASPYTSPVTCIEAIRLEPDGTIDTSYGKGGVSIVPLPASAIGSGPPGAALDGEDRLMLATGSEQGLLLYRLNPAGELDASFGDGGVAQSSMGGYSFELALQPDGRIVVCSDEGRIARFLSEGSPDPSFAEAGQEQLPQLSGTAEDSVALQPDGRILLAGTTEDSESPLPRDFIVARLTANGDLDPTMGTGGISTTAIGELAVSAWAFCRMATSCSQVKRDWNTSPAPSGS